MKRDRYEELLDTLRRWRDSFAENLRDQIEEEDRKLEQRAQTIHRSEGVGEDFEPWLERFCRQLAIQFILKTLFIRVLEDRGQLKVRRIRTRDSQQLFEQLTLYLGATSYLRFVFRDAAYLLPDLFAETEQDIVWPAEDLANEFLEEVWRRSDVDRPGWLRFDFRGDGFDTRFIGDIYQHIDDQARQYYALVQTPEFVSQFLLEHTLVKRFQEKDFREVTLIDSTCGSGHLLLDAFKLWRQRYEERYPGWSREKIFRTIVERHLFGADINEYACALARFRLLIEGCNWARVRDLNAFRDLHFNIVCCDSLIPYEDPNVVHQQATLGQTGAEVAVQIAETFGAPETVRRAVALFSRRYDVAVGNPPYISPKDPRKRQLYREWYPSAYGKYGLAAPFVERFLQLVERGGRVGMINSNAFARRQYGRKLIEEVLPHYDLEVVIDLSGAYIPGHGTPTLILFARNQPPAGDTVIVLSNLKGELSTPADPTRGKVWQSVVRGFAAGPGYADEHVDVAARPRNSLARHPWQFGGAKSRLYECVRENAAGNLDDVAESIGITLFTLTDEVYVFPPDFARRRRFSRDHLREMVTGEGLRDWTINEVPMALFPYERDSTPFDIGSHPMEKAYLESYREVLANTYLFGGRTKVEGGYQWFEYGRLTAAKYLTPVTVAHAFIATHNHFVLTDGSWIFNRSAQIIKLPAQNEESYLFITSLLNTNVICLCLKQLCFDKRAGRDPVRDTYYELAATNVGRLPIPRDYEADTPNRHRMLVLAEETISLAEQLSALSMRKLFKEQGEAYHAWNSSLHGYISPHPDLLPPFTTARELREARDWAIELRRDIRHRMIFLQEEMDWLAYEMYGLIPRAPLAEDYLGLAEFKNMRLELGQRAFEQAGNGYKGDWPKSWKKGAKGPLPGPAAHLSALSETMQRLIQDRIDVIRTNKDITLLEDPLYKRRWIPPDTDKEFRQTLEWWMREMAEWELERVGRPLHIKEWSRRLMEYERVRAALEVYTGTPTYDPVSTIEKIIQAEAVPNHPEHYMKPSGLHKLARGEHEFKRDDFSDGVVWTVRGKLNIPRERWIIYTSFEPGWYGWAGWDAEKRSEALVHLLEQAARAGWTVHHQQCGLRASLRELLPELDYLPAADQQEFETIAYMCGIREPCFCQAFRDADAEKRPPGFASPKLKRETRKVKTEQLSLF